MDGTFASNGEGEAEEKTSAIFAINAGVRGSSAIHRSLVDTFCLGQAQITALIARPATSRPAPVHVLTPAHDANYNFDRR